MMFRWPSLTPNCWTIHILCFSQISWSLDYLIFIGPPLTPRPKFHVVNATHIEIEWDKPFALPEFDVLYYNLSIVNTSLENDTSSNELFIASESTGYPIRHYISNMGDIPKECVYLNFNLTATSDAGTSDPGSVSGGFPIGKSHLTSHTTHCSYIIVALCCILWVFSAHVEYLHWHVFVNFDSISLYICKDSF